MTYSTAPIKARNGRIVQVDLAATVGDMGVTRNFHDDEWTLTHLPTGFRLPYTFPSSIGAEQAALALDEIVEWNGTVQILSRDQRPNAIYTIGEIIREHGGTRSESKNVDNTELRRRLDALGSDSAPIDPPQPEGGKT